MTSYEPRMGDYGVVRTGGFFGKLIRLGTVSRWNHAFIYVGDGKIVEANPTGVAISNLSNYSPVAWNQHENLTDEQRKNICSFALSAIGKPYNFLVIFILVLRILGFKLLANTRLLYKLSQGDGYICSELVAEAYTKSNVPLIAKSDDQITPGDLAERLIYQ